LPEEQFGLRQRGLQPGRQRRDRVNPLRAYSHTRGGAATAARESTRTGASAPVFFAQAAERYIRPDKRRFCRSFFRKSLFILSSSKDILGFATDWRPVRHGFFSC
jgi:hypothetical protein